MVSDIISFSGGLISTYSLTKEAQIKIIQSLWNYTLLVHKLKTFDELLNQKEVKITIDVDVKDADKKLLNSLAKLWKAKQYQTFDKAVCKT